MKNYKQTFIIIMGAGRCGTSSMVSYLNSKDNFDIYGENHGAISKLLSALNDIEITKKFSQNNIKTNFHTKYATKSTNLTEWYNSHSKLTYLESSIKNNILFFFKNEAKYIGFKDIRWDKHINLSFLESTYPNYKYIYLYRDIEDQINSMKKNNYAFFNYDKTKDPYELITFTNKNIEQYLSDKKHYRANISKNVDFLQEAYNFIIDT